jgi:hypothetical protein
MLNLPPKLTSSFFISLLLITLLTIGMTWFITSYWLNEFVQGILYPYSDYQIIVSQFGNVLMIPGWILMCLVSILGFNEIALTFSKNDFFSKLKSKSLLGMLVLVIFSVVAVIADYLIWKSAALANGYSKCPSESRLLLGSKTSSAWSKEQYLCYDYNIDLILSTGTHQQIIEVTKYLSNISNQKK